MLKKLIVQYEVLYSDLFFSVKHSSEMVQLPVFPSKVAGFIPN